MKEHKDYLFVEVYEFYHNFRIGKSKGLQHTLFASGPVNGNSWELPKGYSYTIIGKGDELTEDEAEPICEGKEQLSTGYWYKDYEKRDSFRFAHAKNSFASLLASLSMKAETTLVIKK